MKTTDDPDTDKTHESIEKKKATRKKFELLRFGELANTRIEPKDWNMWRYFGVFTADNTLYPQKRLKKVNISAIFFKKQTI